MARVANVHRRRLRLLSIFHTFFSSLSLSFFFSLRVVIVLLDDYCIYDCENMEMLEKRVSAGDLLHSRRINYTSVRVYIYFIIRIARRIRKGEKIIINNSTQRSNEK